MQNFLPKQFQEFPGNPSAFADHVFENRDGSVGLDAFHFQGTFQNADGPEIGMPSSSAADRACLSLLRSVAWRNLATVRARSQSLFPLPQIVKEVPFVVGGQHNELRRVDLDVRIRQEGKGFSGCRRACESEQI